MSPIVIYRRRFPTFTAMFCVGNAAVWMSQTFGMCLYRENSDSSFRVTFSPMLTDDYVGRIKAMGCEVEVQEW